ncbi:Vacuolar H+/Ca2+ exchanger [Striga asiatica]|uniref:Vacuolar H+/Ca2+ exchanger n=1 Tax=Striga asiatica TaxID=4170 RepID=A0A5A7P4J4_STRAF|nr:Vacuolar H+/Ca2+ exchanger [Striga asiatica]
MFENVLLFGLIHLRLASNGCNNFMQLAQLFIQNRVEYSISTSNVPPPGLARHQTLAAHHKLPPPSRQSHLPVEPESCCGGDRRTDGGRPRRKKNSGDHLRRATPPSRLRQS